jgi:hypothetical protein
MTGQTAWVIRRLRQVAELQVIPGNVSNRLFIRVGGGAKRKFDVVERRLISEERALALVADSHRNSARRLYATQRLTPRVRAILRDAEMSWIERETGFCHLFAPGLLVDVEQIHSNGKKESQQTHIKRPAALLRDRSGLIAETILSYAGNEPLTLSKVAIDSGVSRSLVSRILGRLTDLGIMVAYGDAPKKSWRARDATVLLDLWAREERSGPEETTGVNLLARSPVDLLHRITRLKDEGIPYALAGVAAANLYVPILNSMPIPEIWIPADSSPQDIARSLDAEIVSTGANVRLWQTTSDAALRRATTINSPAVKSLPGIRIVSRERAYIEANNASGRGSDVAAALRRTLELAFHDVHASHFEQKNSIRHNS